jgi:hypothetical protein
VPAVPAAPGGDPLADDDVQLSLYLTYELHYRGFAGVEAGWEWQPSLIALRGALERAFESALRAADAPDPRPSGDVPGQLRAILDQADGRSLSRYLESRATLEQFHEFVVHRSAYQLKEADPHSWAIPRLGGRAKVALVEIQADEYGGGRADRMHARLFADAMEALGLDGGYGAYLDLIPGTTLATVNVMSLFGLHRRLRGAIVGHLAALEMDSTLPNRRYGNGLRRLGQSAGATDFFDEHVEADAVHETLAAHDLAGPWRTTTRRSPPTSRSARGPWCCWTRAWPSGCSPAGTRAGPRCAARWGARPARTPGRPAARSRRRPGSRSACACRRRTA